MNLKLNVPHLYLMPAEKFMMTMALAAGLIAVPSFLWRELNVDWAGYGSVLLVVLSLLLVGYIYRASGRSERIGAATTCAGLFTLFAAGISMFNYMLLPISFPPIDLQLNAIDKMFGYHWPAVIEWSGQHPVINEIIRVAYLSTLPQFAVLIVVLGLSGRIKELHVLIVSVTISTLFVVMFWWVFPTLGAVSLYDLPQSMEALASPNLGTIYGDLMVQMAFEGPGFITPTEIKGLISFPSYHIVLAVIAVYSARTVPWVATAYLVLNIILVPGIFLHGGHHLVDLPAGIIVGIAGIYLARNIVYGHYKKLNLPALVAG